MHTHNQLPSSKSMMHFLKKNIVLFLAPILLLAGLTIVVQASTPIDTGYRDFTYPADTGNGDRVTGEKPESKLWYTDGRWWGSLWSTSENAYTIHWLDLRTNDWIDSGTKLDTRNDSKADVLWDATTQKLYVVSHVFSDKGSSTSNTADWGKLFRYSYDTNTRTYSLDSGFAGGVNVTQGTNETLVVEKDSTGRLWVAYVEDGKVMINYSNATSGGDDDWATPILLPVGDDADVGSDDIASLIAYNGHIGIMWSQQSGTDKMYFGIHDDTDSPNTDWSHIVAYSASSDDHINLKSLQINSSGHIYAVVKTSINNPVIVLLSCTNQPCTSVSDWSADSVNDGSGGPTRPIVLIDEENDDLYVVIASRSEDNIYYKQTALSSISFVDDELGESMIVSDDYNINDPTSTKQNVNNESGLLILASSHGADSGGNWYYFHNCLPLDGADKCYSPAYAPSVTIGLSGGSNEDVLLDWTNSHDAAANLKYEVFESTTPYFSPDSLSPVATVTSSPWNITRSDAAGDAANNHFYIIRAVNYNLTTPATAVSNHIGEFDFAIEPGV